MHPAVGFIGRGSESHRAVGPGQLQAVGIIDYTTPRIAAARAANAECASHRSGQLNSWRSCPARASAERALPLYDPGAISARQARVARAVVAGNAVRPGIGAWAAVDDRGDALIAVNEPRWRRLSGISVLGYVIGVGVIGDDEAAACVASCECLSLQIKFCAAVNGYRPAPARVGDAADRTDGNDIIVSPAGRA